MKNLGLESYNVDINDSEFADKVIALSESLPGDMDLRQKIRQNNYQMLDDAILQFAGIRSALQVK